MARLPSSAATSPRLRPLWRLDTESRLDTGDQESPGEAGERQNILDYGVVV